LGAKGRDLPIPGEQIAVNLFTAKYSRRLKCQEPEE
jgi:hypothetical protein